MIRVINPYYDKYESIEPDLLKKYKYIVFETNDFQIVYYLLEVRFIALTKHVKINNFKLELIDNIENLEDTLYISYYQILWDILFELY